MWSLISTRIAVGRGRIRVLGRTMQFYTLRPVCRGRPIREKRREPPYFSDTLRELGTSKKLVQTTPCPPVFRHVHRTRKPIGKSAACAVDTFR